MTKLDITLSFHAHIYSTVFYAHIHGCLSDLNKDHIAIIGRGARYTNVSISLWSIQLCLTDCIIIPSCIGINKHKASKQSTLLDVARVVMEHSYSESDTVRNKMHKIQ